MEHLDDSRMDEKGCLVTSDESQTKRNIVAILTQSTK